MLFRRDVLCDGPEACHRTEPGATEPCRKCPAVIIDAGVEPYREVIQNVSALDFALNCHFGVKWDEIDAITFQWYRVWKEEHQIFEERERERIQHEARVKNG